MKPGDTFIVLNALNTSLIKTESKFLFNSPKELKISRLNVNLQIILLFYVKFETKFYKKTSPNNRNHGTIVYKNNKPRIQSFKSI